MGECILYDVLKNIFICGQSLQKCKLSTIYGIICSGEL